MEQWQSSYGYGSQKSGFENLGASMLQPNSNLQQCFAMYPSIEHHIRFEDRVDDICNARLHTRQKISNMLRHMRQGLPTCEQTLNGMVVHIEQTLYSQAPSMEEYMNQGTLKDRVEAIIRHEAAAVKTPSTMMSSLSMGASDKLNAMHLFGPEVTFGNVYLSDFQYTSNSNRLPQHGALILPEFVRDWTYPSKVVGDNRSAFIGDFGWKGTGLLEDIVLPPPKFRKMHDYRTSQLWDDHINQPHPSQEFSFTDKQSDNFPCNSQELCGYTSHPPDPHSFDKDCSQDWVNIKELKNMLKASPHMDGWHHSYDFESESMEHLVPNSTAPTVWNIDNSTAPTVDHLAGTCLGKQKIDCSLTENPTAPTVDHLAGAYVEKQKIHCSLIENPTAPTVDNLAGAYVRKKKINCSLIEMFAPEQIKQHITSLRLCVMQNREDSERNEANSETPDKRPCNLCAIHSLSFAPLKFCSSCSAPIKLLGTYYSTEETGLKYCVCSSCYRKIGGKSVTLDGHCIYKSSMEKITNKEDAIEPWVECRKCELWQHEICSLFNDKKNENGSAKYICPECYIKDIKSGEHTPLPQDASPGAKDLPRTSLSDHIENRLIARLNKEREERAKSVGRNFDEVPGAEDLVVRVVLSIEKKAKVKQKFFDVFAKDKYPKEFPYRSKVILLFQKIEGVDVCLFGMYVQEYGSECPDPNNRCIYLSYLDSVKYFRPEIQTVNGEALRTFVYHEILIGYLDYCKKQGFSTCYIWTCPPMKGDNYVLYRHPEVQKAPNTDKLRKWYLSMLKKATKENVVVAVTNLYDGFFFRRHECKLKVTHLPYFYEDYWPALAEETIHRIQVEENGEILKRKSRTALKARGCNKLSESSVIRNVLMDKISDHISQRKENFIMVQLQYFCGHCSQPILSGRWVCNQCKDFQLCERCYVDDQNLEERNKHPSSKKAKHNFSKVEAIDVIVDPEYKNEHIYNKIFEDRQTFLRFCQEKYYQHDMLRRAKHSSMMILYYLHNPAEAASEWKNVLENIEKEIQRSPGTCSHH